MRILKNYFKVAWRNLVRKKVYSAINIFGLATGISACILIFLYVQDELTYENQFANAERLARVVTDISLQGEHDKIASTPYRLSLALQDKYPEIESVTKIAPIHKQTLWINNTPFNQENLFYADSNFFRVFDYTFLQGDAQSALNRPKTIVLTEEMAVKYFGSPDKAMGKTVRFSKNPHQVTGVIQDARHSHLKIEALLSAATLGPASPKDEAMNSATNWFLLAWYTYVLLHDKSQIPVLQKNLDLLSKNTIAPWIKENSLTATQNFYLQPIRDIHFNANWSYDISPAGNPSYVYIFGCVALFILLIACINYMNLATARSAKRAREVGLRKVVGANKGQLVRQFIGESVLITLFAILIALSLVEVLLPVFNELTGKNFSSVYFTHTGFILALLAIITFVGLVAGSYPAFFLSNINPAIILKSDRNQRGGSGLLRKALVVLQFTISLILIFGTLVVYSQMQYLKNADLGFRKEQVLVIDIPVGDTTLVKRLSAFKNELSQHPNILQISNSDYLPGTRTSRLLALVNKNGKKEEMTLSFITVDKYFLPLMDIPVKQGLNFSEEMKGGLEENVLINQIMADKMGWKDPIGQKLEFAESQATVIGVIQNFHYTSLHNPIEPLVITLKPESPGYLFLRLRKDNIAETVDFIKEEWRQFDTRHPLEFSFLEESFNKQYQSEEKMLSVFGYFAALTIIIACLGLLGLTSFTAEQRTREIGIRKVMGSSVADIVIMLSRDFALLVTVAIVFAGPVAWYGMNKWLEDFAYRTPLNWWMFLTTGLFALVIAMLTVSIQAAKAANKNPVNALRAD